MSRLFQFFFLFLSFAVQAQFTYVLDQDIPVRDITGDDLPMPWAGGLNAAHYNTMDLNEDGKDDLVLFDRMADKVITFLNDNNQYKYAPEFESFFPSEITNWLLLRDVNCDGKKDIFTGDNLGIKVYFNVTPAGENLSWKQFFFYSGFPGTKSTVLLTKGFSGKINLQLQFDDLPAIVDADGDGDLDIFNVRFVGNGTVEYHKNFSVERYGTCDSLDFERITQKWGGFTECSCGNFAFNNEDCPPVVGGRTQHAGGKSLLAIDANNDNKLDLLFSEASCANLFLLRNDGSLDNPVINSSSLYPPDNPANFLIFPAAFYEDVDFDNRKDLVAIPNIFSKTYLQTNLNHSNWLYKNTGTNAAPSFTFSKTDFLQDQMIDVGDSAVPAFIDFDGDGDYDLFISQNATDDLITTIRLYENTGTPSLPAFVFKDEDIWGLSQLFLYNMKIQFSDINRDGNIDLAFTATSYQTGLTKLYYVLNMGSSSVNFSNQPVQTSDVTVGFSENISIADVNKDGLPDLLIGKATGSLEYWKNTSTDNTPVFSLEDATYLELGSTVLRQNIACAVSDFDGNGKADLVYGDQTGQLKMIGDFREVSDASSAVTGIVFNPLAAGYEAKNLGGRIWPTAVNLFSSTKPAIVVGNVLGGLSILRHDEGASLPDSPVIEIYPNPVPKTETLTLKIDRPGSVQLFSMLGQKVSESVYLQPNEEYAYRVPYLSAGVYILKFTVTNKSFAKRIVIY